MPLAPAHPAVVLPLERLGLPLSALTVGAVAPDAAVYLPVPVSYATTHSGAGLLVDVLIGLVLLAIWDHLVRDAVVDLVSALRARRPLRKRLDRRAWLLAPLSVAIGAATHVLWDSVTHEWGFVVEGIDFLQDEQGAMPLYGWLQLGSTVVGTVVVTAYGVGRLRAMPTAPRRSVVPRPGLWLLPVPLTGTLVGLVAREANAAVGAALLALLAVAVAWRVSARFEPADRRPRRRASRT